MRSINNDGKKLAELCQSRKHPIRIFFFFFWQSPLPEREEKEEEERDFDHDSRKLRGVLKSRAFSKLRVKKRNSALGNFFSTYAHHDSSRYSSNTYIPTPLPARRSFFASPYRSTGRNDELPIFFFPNKIGKNLGRAADARFRKSSSPKLGDINSPGRCR